MDDDEDNNEYSKNKDDYQNKDDVKRGRRKTGTILRMVGVLNATSSSQPGTAPQRLLPGMLEGHSAENTAASLQRPEQSSRKGQSLQVIGILGEEGQKILVSALSNPHVMV